MYWSNRTKMQFCSFNFASGSKTLNLSKTAIVRSAGGYWSEHLSMKQHAGNIGTEWRTLSLLFRFLFRIVTEHPAVAANVRWKKEDCDCGKWSNRLFYARNFIGHDYDDFLLGGGRKVVVANKVTTFPWTVYGYGPIHVSLKFWSFLHTLTRLYDSVSRSAGYAISSCTRRHSFNETRRASWNSTNVIENIAQ